MYFTTAEEMCNENYAANFCVVGAARC